MKYILTRFVILTVAVALIKIAIAQNLSFPSRGTLIITGGSITKEGIKSFVDNAGGAGADLIFIPSASSGIRLDSGFTWEPADTSTEKIRAFEDHLASYFGVKKITVLHTTRKEVANSEQFAKRIATANGVWLGSGNAGRYADIFLGTKTWKELNKLLARGGVIGGNSAGSIIQCSYIIRGRPDKPVLMAAGHEQGFGFLKNVVINPHLLSAKRETELVNVLDRHPELTGFGIDDEITFVIKKGIIETKGDGLVYVYDNQLHDGKWWYTFAVGKKFSLKDKKVVE